MAVTLSVTRG